MNRLLPDWRQAAHGSCLVGHAAVGQAGGQAVAVPAPERAAQSTPGPSARAAALVCTDSGTGVCWERVSSSRGCSGSALTSQDSFLR